MDKGQRVTLIQNVRDMLKELQVEDQDLLLETFGIGAQPYNPFGDYPSLTSWLSQAGEENLLELAQNLGVLENTATHLQPSVAATNSGPLFIFASHLSKHRRFLGDVAAELARFGIKLFVAHDSITMDAPWEKEIVGALNTCHAGAVFIHPGLHESHYCMQETGWMLGRGIPLARLMIGEAPRGLLGELQGKPVAGWSPAAVAAELLDWSVSHETLHPALATSLVAALARSNSFARTDQIWSRLDKVHRLTSEQMEKVIAAAETNDQIYGAVERGRSSEPYRRVIGRRLEAWGVPITLADRAAWLRDDALGNYRATIQRENPRT